MRNLDFSQNEETSDGKLFELVYEKKPLRTKADYKYVTSFQVLSMLKIRATQYTITFAWGQKLRKEIWWQAIGMNPG